MKSGILIVQQLHGKEVFRRDFDAAYWRYHWCNRSDGIVLLRLERVNPGWQVNEPDPGLYGSFEFAEFSAPVSIHYEIYDE